MTWPWHCHVWPIVWLHDIEWHEYQSIGMFMVYILLYLHGSSPTGWLTRVMFLHVHVLPWSSHSGFRCMHVSCSYFQSSSHTFFKCVMICMILCVQVCMACLHGLHEWQHHIGFMSVMLSCWSCLQLWSFRLASRPMCLWFNNCTWYSHAWSFGVCVFPCWCSWPNVPQAHMAQGMDSLAL